MSETEGGWETTAESGQRARKRAKTRTRDNHKSRWMPFDHRPTDAVQVVGKHESDEDAIPSKTHTTITTGGQDGVKGLGSRVRSVASAHKSAYTDRHDTRPGNTEDERGPRRSCPPPIVHMCISLSKTTGMPRCHRGERGQNHACGHLRRPRERVPRSAVETAQCTSGHPRCIDCARADCHTVRSRHARALARSLHACRFSELASCRPHATTVVSGLPAATWAGISRPERCSRQHEAQRRQADERRSRDLQVVRIQNTTSCTDHELVQWTHGWTR
ncbi:uncharacterized protein B0H18DRAFT_26849 [Fomitopsis serialis]|uniref:uncharacterized protein n=1 Tax=Fomitopsis serialis TaxID=139415 RepID=UPI0020078E99|nr:uncharacterized protein B0H18DRAFT_26849 [Neoantrodia serialis]KAH9932490.1 hypothetical protein B0H18DRAFT_26849 [Neoantrodia serialis]